MITHGILLLLTRTILTYNSSSNIDINNTYIGCDSMQFEELNNLCSLPKEKDNEKNRE